MGTNLENISKKQKNWSHGYISDKGQEIIVH
jgi:hypothetical protein